MTTARERASIRLMPREKHEHRFISIHRQKGRWVRYRCDCCPAIDPRWYGPQGPSGAAFLVLSEHYDADGTRVIDKLVPMSFGLVYDSPFPGSEPEVDDNDYIPFIDGKPAIGGVNVLRSLLGDIVGTEVTAEDVESLKEHLAPQMPGLRAQFDKVREIGVGHNASFHDDKTGENIPLGDVKVYIDTEHPHANLPAEPTMTMEKLSGLDKKQLQTIAVTFDVKHNTKTTKAQLIDGILAAQEASDAH